MNNGASVARFLPMHSDASASIKMCLHRYYFTSTDRLLLMQVFAAANLLMQERCNEPW